MTESSNDHLSASEASCRGLIAFLYSVFDGTVDTVRVSDKGSKSQFVNVQVQGVTTSGILDTGADITIMGGKLFKKIAVAARLRKKDPKKADRIPRTYDGKQFKLHGRMDLEITFDQKVLCTPIYIKMDAHDQLLLAEGVCSQLGIVEYHQNVWPGKKLQKDAHIGDNTVLSVRKVSLLRDITVPAIEAVMIGVAIEGSELQNRSLLLEDSDNLDGAGLEIQRSLFMLNKKGEATVIILRFSEKIPKGTVAVKVCSVCHLGNDYGNENIPSIVEVRKVGGNETIDIKIKEQKTILLEILGELDLPPEERKQMLTLLYVNTIMYLHWKMESVEKQTCSNLRLTWVKLHLNVSTT